MNKTDQIKFYGVTKSTKSETTLDAALEELSTLGYTTIDSGLSKQGLAELSDIFDSSSGKYIADVGGLNRLKSIDEHNTFRCPMKYDRQFLTLAMNAQILEPVQRAIGQPPVLPQQNGIVNPKNSTTYNQGLWHRDLPYQHVVFLRPIAANALFCLDDFTLENGAPKVLARTHKQENFPSEKYVTKHFEQITVKAGTFIVLDCMMYHSGSENQTSKDRSAVNHVYTIPLLRQQVSLPTELGEKYPQSIEEVRFLGYPYETPSTVSDFLNQREAR